MKSESDNEALLKRFLLGDLSEAERAELEDRFLADDRLFQQLSIDEDDLIDAYVRGSLRAAERALFERSYLATRHGRQRVEFARSLFNSISGRKDALVKGRRQGITTPWWRSLFDRFFGGRPALGFTLAAVLLVGLLGGLWLLIEKARTRTTTRPSEAAGPATVEVLPRESPSPPVPSADQPQSQQDGSSTQPAPSKEPPKRTPVVVATFTLQPGMVRGEGGGNSIVLPAGATEVRLRLVLDGETYKQYRATLSTAEGSKLWGRLVNKGALNKSSNLTLTLPADLLRNGDYVLELGGANADGNWESVADYSFRIVRK